MQPIDPNPPRRVDRPLMLQDWRDVCFLHWRAVPEELTQKLPRGLQLDTFDGSAWLGLTPFRVEKFRPRFLPAFPWLSSFAEMNVRTYVRGPDGEPAVWFFSLEADRLLATVGANLAFSLPYKWASVNFASSASRIDFRLKRRGVEVELSYTVGAHVSRPSEFEKFLTARFKLFTVIDGRLHSVQIEHAPWPIHQATLLNVRETLTASLGLWHLPSTPHLMFSPGVATRIGKPHRVMPSSHEPVSDNNLS
jgi:uncharacterized protein